MQCVAVPTVDIAERGITDVDGLLQHGLEQRVQIAGRATDDLQHFRRSRLLLKGLAQFTQQSRVLYRNGGLGGEVRDQLNVFLSECAHLRR